MTSKGNIVHTPIENLPNRQSSWVLSLISLSGPKQRSGCSQQWAMWAPFIKQVPCHPWTNCRPSNTQQVQRMRATHVHGSGSYVIWVIWEHCKMIHIWILEPLAVTVCPMKKFKSKLKLSCHPLASPWLPWKLSLCKSSQKRNAYLTVSYCQLGFGSGQLLQQKLFHMFMLLIAVRYCVN